MESIQSIREQIAAHLRRDVFSGKIGQGEALREQHLAKRFGVSRGPIRDALLQLSKEGLVVAERNRGARVGTQTSPESRRLIVGLRRQVETFALRQLWPSVDDGLLQAWEADLVAFREACLAEDVGLAAEVDIRFHESIFRALGDENLLEIWMPIVTHMMLPYSRHKTLMEAYEEHRRILEAIVNRDKTAALKRLEANIQ
ncbi:MAG: GntR family transcriptional regulator [Opitutales bacterium]